MLSKLLSIGSKYHPQKPIATIVGTATSVGLSLIIVIFGLTAFDHSPAGAADMLPGEILSEPDPPLSAVDMIPSADTMIQREGPSRIFTSENLIEFDESNASLYLEFGFIEVATQKLVINEHSYNLDIYQMDCPLEAFALFSLRRYSGAMPIGNLPYSFIEGYYGVAICNQFLFQLSPHNPSPDLDNEWSTILSKALERLGKDKIDQNLTSGFPFNRLPLAGRLPGTERLARGPIGLRAALGEPKFFSWSVGDAIRAVQIALVMAELRTGSEHPKPVKQPWWVLSGYHPQVDQDQRLKPKTFVAQAVLGDMINIPPIKDLLDEAHSALSKTIKASYIEKLEQGILWSRSPNSHGCIIHRGGDLLFASSTMPYDPFRNWATNLSAQQ